MRRLVCYLTLLLIILNTSLLAYSSDPKEFVNELVGDALGKLSDKNLNQDQKINFIENVALENVDINALSLYTLGELRKSSSKDDLIDYQKSFLII